MHQDLSEKGFFELADGHSTRDRVGINNNVGAQTGSGVGHVALGDDETGGSFLAMAVWILVPDKLDNEEQEKNPRFGIFATTVVAFFIAEMGDKTQVATVMLAAQFNSWFWVVTGTTLGMMLANAPVVWLGDAITRKISLKWVHRTSAVVFAVLGGLALWGGPSKAVAPETPPEAPQKVIAHEAAPAKL